MNLEPIPNADLELVFMETMSAVTKAILKDQGCRCVARIELTRDYAMPVGAQLSAHIQHGFECPMMDSEGSNRGQ